MTIATVTLNPCIDKTFTVERVVPDRKLSAENLRDYPGGGGINVARVLSRLACDVRALWSCGGDTGRRLEQLLAAEGVPQQPIPIDGSVRENLIVEDASSGEQYRFGMPGAELSPAERARWVEAIGALPTSTSILVLSGSLPAGVPVEWYEELLRAVPAGIRVVVDTKQEPLRRALRAGVFLIKPNVRELEDITGRELGDDAAIAQAARELIAPGSAEMVVVSLGRGGALLVTADATQHVRSPSVRPRSKVGAGDSMVAGLVWALSRGCAPREAVRYGVAAGAAAVMTPGTELARAQDIERLVRCSAPT